MNFLINEPYIWTIREYKMLAPLIYDSTLEIYYFILFFKLTLLEDYVNWHRRLWKSKLEICFLNECSKLGLNPQLFHPHSKALTTKPSPHMIIKSDIAKYINTYLNNKSDYFYITIWCNWFGRFIITLNFEKKLIQKYV
jgi:hypothetical protein